MYGEPVETQTPTSHPSAEWPAGWLVPRSLVRLQLINLIFCKLLPELVVATYLHCLYLVCHWLSVITIFIRRKKNCRPVLLSLVILGSRSVAVWRVHSPNSPEIIEEITLVFAKWVLFYVCWRNKLFTSLCSTPCAPEGIQMFMLIRNGSGKHVSTPCVMRKTGRLVVNDAENYRRKMRFNSLSPCAKVIKLIN